MNDPFGISKAAPTKAVKTLAFKKPQVSGPDSKAPFSTPGDRVHQEMRNLQSKAKKKGFLRRMK